MEATKQAVKGITRAIKSQVERMDDFFRDCLDLYDVDDASVLEINPEEFSKMVIDAVTEELNGDLSEVFKDWMERYQEDI